MGRKKQIYDAGQQYLDSMDEFQRYHTYPKGAFIDGAIWADKHPKSDMVNKQEFIEKSVKYLEANFPDIENVGGWYKESFINNFRKTMEE